MVMKAKPNYLNDNQIKYLVNSGCKKKESALKKAESKKKSNDHIDPNIIEFKLLIKVGGVEMRVCTLKQDYFFIGLNKFVFYASIYSEMKDVFISLSSINVKDLAEQSNYKDLVCLATNDENLVSVNLKIFEPPKTSLTLISKLAAEYQFQKFYFKNYNDKNHVDLDVKASISQLKLTLIYKYLHIVQQIVKLLNFKPSSPENENMQLQKQQQQQQLVAETNAGEKNEFEFLYRFRLDVLIKAPLIIFPESSFSENCLKVDLGILNIATVYDIKNDYYSTTKKNEEGTTMPRPYNDVYIENRCLLPPIIQTHNITLTNIKIYRSSINDKITTNDSNMILLDCRDFLMSVNLNMRTCVFSDIEPIAVEFIYYGLELFLSRQDYTFILGLTKSLNEFHNISDLTALSIESLSDLLPLSQKKNDGADAAAEAPLSTQKVSIKEWKNSNLNESSMSQANSTTPKITLKLAISEIILNLFDENQSDRSADKAFCQFSLRDFQAEIENYDFNNLLRVQMQLDNIVMDDTRLAESNNKIIRIFNKHSATTKKTLPASGNPMVEMKFQQQITRDSDSNSAAESGGTEFFSNEKDLDLKIQDLVFCMNVDYFILLTNFFVIPDEFLETKNNNSTTKKQQQQQPIYRNLRSVLNFQINLENPHIILYDNQHDFVKSSCIILEGNFKVSLKSRDENLKIFANLSDLVVRNKLPIHNRNRISFKNYPVLMPASMTVTVQVKNQTNRTVTVDLNGLDVRLCPWVIKNTMKMVDSVLKSVNNFADSIANDKKPQLESISADDKITDTAAAASLLNPVKFEDQDFWFTTTATLAKTETEDPAATAVKQQFAKLQVMLRATKATLRFESSFFEKIPLIATEFCLDGELSTDDCSGEMNFILSLSVEMSYFNENLNFYEPIIEPNEIDSSEVFKPYELFIELNKKTQTGNRRSGGSSAIQRSQSVESALAINALSENMNVETSIQINSNDSLNFVVTKTFLNVLEKMKSSFSQSDKEDESTTKMTTATTTLDGSSRKSSSPATFNSLTSTTTAVGGRKIDEFVEEYENEEEKYLFSILFKNELGTRVSMISSEKIEFQDLNFGSKSIEISSVARSHNVVILNDNEFCPIKIKNQPSTASLQNKQRGNKDQNGDCILKAIDFSLKLPDQGDKLLNIKANLNGLTLNTLSSFYIESKDCYVISDVDSSSDRRIISLRSSVQILNSLELAVQIDYEIKGVCRIRQLKPGEKWSLPLEYVARSIQSKPFKIVPMVDGFESITKQTVNLESIESNQLLSFEGSIFVQAIVTNTQSSYSKMIKLLPPVTIFNYLPFPLQVKAIAKRQVEASMNLGDQLLEPGESTSLLNARANETYLDLEIPKYQGIIWYSSFLIENAIDGEKIETIEFRSPDLYKKILSIACLKQIRDNSISLTIYAPYWILNRSNLLLEYKFENSKANEADIDMEANNGGQPTLLIIDCDTFMMEKKKIFLRVKSQSGWSQPFLIDAVGNNGTVTCKSLSRNREQEDAHHYEIGVDIKLSTNGLTKIITFTPYFIFINKTDFRIVINQCSNNKNCSLNHQLNVMPNSFLPFYPINYCGAEEKKNESVFIQLIDDTNPADSLSSYSQPFWFTTKHQTVLVINDKKIVNVECIPNEEIIKILFTKFSYGMAPALIINKLRNTDVVVNQKGNLNKQISVKPQYYFMKTWDNPGGERLITINCGLLRNQMISFDSNEIIQKFKIDEKTNAYFLTFLDGLQRVIMFVQDQSLIRLELIGMKEIYGNEYVLNLKNLSLSLIDDINGYEIIYMAITSSTISWISKPKKDAKVGKQLPDKFSNALEEGHRRYLIHKANMSDANLPNEMRFMKFASGDGDVGDEISIDFEKMLMKNRTTQIPIERQYSPCVYINYFQSTEKRTIHMKIHKLQIDNQLFDCVFPVIFSKVLPPKTVAAEGSIVKPLIELSLVENHNQATDCSEIKYFKVLIQEFSIKVDIMLLNAINKFFKLNELTIIKSLNSTPQQNSTAIQSELDQIKIQNEQMLDMFICNGSKEKLIYIDMCHISPLKVHLSFTFSNSDISDNILLNNPFTKSIGLVLSDMQDVVFKLGYFEVRNTTYSWTELQTEVLDHYKSQVIKQVYILVLGLDVLGNPFGLIRGLTEGVESLFYEPYAGLIQGPSEFVEGVALGVRNLVGSALGGAAGAFSKITGTLGKGIATLTFDKEFQKARQKQSDPKSSSFLQNVGQNLVMGVVTGVTGLVEKPIEGAKESGVMGLIGGIGKGVIGVVARPTGGLVDFTTQSLEGIRKVAVQEESIYRTRAPRFIQADHLIRPYRYKEAKALTILKGLEKGKFADMKYVTSLENSDLMLIATEACVILLMNRMIFGNEKLEWFHYYEDLDIPPFIQDRRIIFFVKCEKSFFSRNTSVEKKVPIKDESEAAKFVQKVSSIMRTKGLYDKK